MDTDNTGDGRTPLRNCPTVEMRAISELKPHPRHARKHTKAKIRRLANSIEALGFNVPVVIDEGDQILAGFACVEAGKSLGMTHVPVISLRHLDPTQALAFMLAHNKLAEDLGWDDKKLALQLKELSELVLSFDIEATGFELPEIDFRIQSLEDIETIDSADDFQLARGEPVSVKGDLWHLDDHRLLCGNVLDANAYPALLSGEKAAATFTDPPYNVKINGNAAGHGYLSYREFPMAVGEMSPAEFTNFLTTALSNIAKNSVPGAIIFVCMDWRHIEEMLAAARTSGLTMINLCVWV